MDLSTTEIIIRMAVAIGLGSLLGLERSLAGKGAGIRTYAMVSIGSSLFAIVSQLVHAPLLATENPLSLAPAIISGIGFIGAGLVLFQAEEHRITGITTAAGLWVAAGAGMAAGYGLFTLGIIATVAAFLVFTIFWFFERAAVKFSYKSNNQKEE